MADGNNLPSRIGPYEVRGEIGRGGMGVVLLARDTRLDRLVALKSLPADLSGDAEATGRLLREARSLAALHHPNIATLFGLEEEGGSTYLVLEYVEGEGLNERIARGPLPVAEALPIFRQVALGLEAAHERGIVHRDLKPANIRITPQGGVKLLDFGLAHRVTPPDQDRISTVKAPLTGEGVVLGTPGYMSPEQMDGGSLDARADLWALGCVLFECLTGQTAFETVSFARAAASALRDDPDWETLPADAPSQVRALLRRCLEKEPSRRPHDCVSVRRELERAMAEPEGDSDAAPRTEAPHNLPHPLTSFVGREAEIEEVIGLLDSARFLTLTGMGGSGKSRLAVEAGRHVCARWRDGAWLVDLAPVTDPRLVARTTASTLGVREQPGKGIREALLGHLRERSMLLILDNCEQIAPACGDLAERLLASCPDVRVLVTSREPLAASGEHVLFVQPLALPDATATPRDLRASEAGRLFLERAGLARAGFSVDDVTAPQVARICRHLDGIPLAIELAAARMRLLEIPQIAERLSDRFRLLRAGEQTRAERHQTLRATIDWSHDLLSGAERVLFRRLAVFAGGCTLDTAEAVVPGEEIDEEQVLDLLSALVDKSLVVVARGRREARYGFLETVAEYARERFQQAGEVTELRRRHAEHFLSLAERWHEGLLSPDPTSTLERVEREQLNFHAALAWCEDSGAEETGIRLAAALGHFWETRGYWEEGIRWLEPAAERARNAGREDQEGRLRNSLGNIAFNSGDMETGKEQLEASLAIARRIGEKRGIAANIHNLGSIALVAGDSSGARRYFKESLEIWQELGEDRNRAICLASLGGIASDEGDLESASGYYRSALALHRDLGDKRGTAWCLVSLGEVTRQSLEPEKARSLLEEGLALYRELGDRKQEGLHLTTLANVAILEDDLESADSLAARSRAICEELGDSYGIVRALGALGRVAHLRGDLAGARVLLTESLRVCRERAFGKLLPACLLRFAQLDIACGLHRRALLLLLAAGEKGQRVMEIGLDETERAAVLSAARESLGEEAFLAAREHGGGLTLDEAARVALEAAPHDS